jgi:hypothetical protein
MFSCGKTRAAKNYSQGNRGTQGKIAKKAEKMQIFQGRVEIPAKNAVPGLPLAIRTGFECPYQADRRGNDKFAKAPGRRMHQIRKGNGGNWQQFGEKFKE